MITKSQILIAIVITAAILVAGWYINNAITSVPVGPIDCSNVTMLIN